METLESPTLMKITPRPAEVMARGAGSYLWDEAGRRYLDFIQGWAVNCLGHCPAEIANALSVQANTLISPSPALHNRPQIKLAERLIALSDFQDVHFANSGAEANEAAVKLAEPRAAAVTAAAFKRGLLVNAARPDVLRFMPSLRVSAAELDEFFGLLDASLAG